MANENMVQNILNDDYPLTGPNCFNTSLRALNLTSSKRYIHVHEMKKYISESCEEINQEDDQIGTLGIIELQDQGIPMHSFIRLSENNVLTKNGFGKRELPKISKMNSMLSLHKKAILMDCKVKKIKPCKVNVKYYNCENLEMSLDQNILDMFKTLTTSRYSYHNINLRNDFIQNVKNEDFRVSCENKKVELHSMALAFNFANMSSRNKEEQKLGDSFFKDVLAYLNTINCEL
jgi:hypothetical protein